MIPRSGRRRFWDEWVISLCWCFVIFFANRFDVAANVHVYDDAGFFWFNCLEKVLGNYFRYRFVENFYISEGVDVEFKGLEFQTDFVWNIFDSYCAKIRPIRKGTNGSVFRAGNADPMLALALFLEFKTQKWRYFFDFLADFFCVFFCVVLIFVVEIV